MLKNSVKLPSRQRRMCPTPNLASVSVPPMYAAFSTPEGRFLSDLFLYRKPRGEEKLDGSGSGPCGDLELFAGVDSSVLDELLQTFKKCYLGISHGCLICTDVTILGLDLMFGEIFSKNCPCILTALWNDGGG